MLPYNIDLTGKTVFLTGVAGFIGSNLAKQLLKTVKNIHIVGIDSMNDYYDVRLKEARLKEIEETLQAPLRRGDVQSTVVSPPLKGDIEGLSSFTFIRGNIADRTLIDRIFADPELSGLALWHFADARTYHRGGSNIRVKLLAENLAGLYDGYRRAKMSTQVVREGFSRKAAGEH